jgi:hypothetical protein
VDFFSLVKFILKINRLLWLRVVYDNSKVAGTSSASHSDSVFSRKKCDFVCDKQFIGCIFSSLSVFKMAPNIKIWKREAEAAAAEPAEEIVPATTLATQIFGHKHHKLHEASTGI